jgi:hypothetical protein
MKSKEAEVPNIYRAIERQALASVEEQNGEWFMRYICRWYSKTFSTPLDSVLDQPEEEVLLAYFEDKFENLVFSSDEEDQEKLREWRRSLTETKEDKFERERIEAIGKTDTEIAHAQDEAMARQAWEKKRAEDAKKPKMTQVPSLDRSISEPSLKDPVPMAIPPDIKMTFVDEDQFEKIVSELDGLSKRK